MKRQWFTALLTLLALLLIQSLPAQAGDEAPRCQAVTVSAPSSQWQWPLHAEAYSHRATTTVETPTNNQTLPDYLRQQTRCLDVTNNTASPLAFAFLLDNARAYHVTLQQTLKDNSTHHWRAGMAYPLATWDTATDDILFPVSLPANTTSRFQLQIGSYIAYTGTLYLADTHTLIESQLYSRSAAGLLTGLILALVLYFGCLALSSREVTYFYLGGSTLAVCLMQLSDIGLLYRYWPASIVWNESASYAFGVISTVFGCQLARHYLHTHNTMPRTDTALNLFTWFLVLVSLPASFVMHQTLALPLFALPASLFMLSLIVISAMRIRQGFAPAKLYLIAYLLPMFSGFGIVLMGIGIIPSTPTTHLIPLFGTAMQLLLFALALGWRIRWLYQESDKTHLHALHTATETDARRQFLAQVSHDLRTPLIGIIGLCELLERQSYSPSEKELIDSLEKSSRQLLTVTNTLLDHAKLDAGKWKVSHTVFHLRELLDDTHRLFEPTLLERQLNLTVEIDPQIPNLLLGDSIILQRILHALLDNACKFTPDGGIHIAVSVTSASTESIHLRFEVCDTGIGLDAAFLQRAFNAFELADDSSTRQQQGFGLGLSLCRKFCQLVNGDIGYQANSTRGSTFWFIQPFTLPSQNAIPSVVSPTKLTYRKGGSLLVAEDDDALRLIFASMFQRMGFTQVHLFPDGRALLDHYRTHPEAVSLVLTDWHMPTMNGQELLIALRQHEHTHGYPAVPIIVMSAEDPQHSFHEQLPDDVQVLYKPVTQPSLRAVLDLIRIPTDNATPL